MKKTLAVLAAASTLTISAALAQQSGNTPTTPPAASTPHATSTTMAPASGAITTQSADEWLASKFKGTDVLGADDKKIGDVTDVLFDRQGSVKAVIVGVGGFLGIGSKDVAFALSQFQVIPGKDGGDRQLKISMTKDQLASAAEFKPHEARPATGAANNTTRPATSPMAPAPTRTQ